MNGKKKESYSGIQYILFEFKTIKKVTVYLFMKKRMNAINKKHHVIRFRDLNINNPTNTMLEIPHLVLCIQNLGSQVKYSYKYAFSNIHIKFSIISLWFVWVCVLFYVCVLLKWSLKDSLHAYVLSSLPLLGL